MAIESCTEWGLKRQVGSCVVIETSRWLFGGARIDVVRVSCVVVIGVSSWSRLAPHGVDEQVSLYHLALVVETCSHQGSGSSHAENRFGVLSWSPLTPHRK